MARYTAASQGMQMMGDGVTGSASVSTTEGLGSAPSPPATQYVNADTLEPVTEDWWPTIRGQEANA